MKFIYLVKRVLALVILLISFSLSAAIKDQTTFEDQYRIANNGNLGMNQRWKALQKATALAQGNDVAKIVAFGDSKDWYMRNASLVALDQLGNNMVYDQAQKLITDKALVVRSAAVDVLSRRDNSDMVKRIYSQELDKKYNFSGKSSLWVRKQMMEYLVKHADKSERDFFVKYLHDQDIEIANLSTQALEKITSIRLSAKTSTDLVQQWKAMAKNQKW